MFLTRCPICLTTFRMTAEQLVMRDGHVRCGSCHHVFNAMEYLLEETQSPKTPPQGPAVLRTAPGENHPQERRPQERRPQDHPDTHGERRPQQPPQNAQNTQNLQKERRPQGTQEEHRRPQDGNSRWAFAPLESMGRRETRRVWPFVLVAIFFLLLFAGQAYFFRAPLSLKNHDFAMLFRSLHATLPPLREAERITIEGSDLIAMTTPGQLYLSGTLRNDAPYEEAWPYLELTLTDAYNAPLARKVFSPNEYLPEGASAIFHPGDVSIDLVLDVGRLPVTGYTLTRFYP
jgi:predicted Zn finger-like uncharacterized protein